MNRTLLFMLPLVSSSLLDRFNEWRQHFSIKHNNEHHLLRLYESWVDNDVFINYINKKNLTYKLEHNEYSGLSANEFNKIMGFSNIKIERRFNNVEYNLSVPTSIDWRQKGVVSPVKNQGQCGSCWSFSTIASVESAYAIKSGKLLSLSEQQLVDCDSRDNGCNGGLMDNAFTWIGKNGGVCLNADYPYVSGTTQKEGTCKSCSNVDGTKVISHVDVTPYSDSSLMTALSLQPVSVAIQADQREFQFYSSGVFTASCGSNLDHGVNLVGYGTLNGVDYWILRNSWGSSWGQSGYMLLGRGNNPSTGKPYNNGAGQCGVLTIPSYPKL